MNFDPPVIFACEASATRGQREAVLLGASLRRFGGTLAGSRLWVMVRDPGAVKTPERALLADQGAEIVPYPADEPAASFPFTGRLLAAAEAEALANRESTLLICMDSASLVLKDPTPLLLPPGKSLGARPVDHANVGSPWEAPADDFWRLVYQRCDVDPAHLFPVAASSDGQPLRAYYNAGLLVLRPAAGLMGAWRQQFASGCRDVTFAPLYGRDPRYRLFVHQAVLSAVIVRRLGRDGVLDLPPTVNYPLHLHGQFRADRKASQLDDLVTVRYEQLLDDPSWARSIPMSQGLRDWLAARVGWLAG